jgi:hypothetical protein
VASVAVLLPGITGSELRLGDDVIWVLIDPVGLSFHLPRGDPRRGP